MYMDSHLLHSGLTSATLVPGRGGLISAFKVSQRQILYLNESTLVDATRNVRGGIPILFPFAGKLVDNVLLDTGTIIGQHGFARSFPWAIAPIAADAAVLSLRCSPETRRIFPYEFATHQTVRVSPNRLHVELAVANEGKKPMPLAPGWHPYFPCLAAERPRVQFDPDDLLPPAALSDAEIDLGISIKPLRSVSFRIPSLGKVTLGFSPNMTHLQIWALPQENFLCVEPFFGSANCLNTIQRDIVSPGTTHIYAMDIAYQAE
jgi:galactose mutarotase-like enzyme